MTYQMGCAVTDQTLRRFGVEAILHVALGDDQASQLAASSIDRRSAATAVLPSTGNSTREVSDISPSR